MKIVERMYLIMINLDWLLLNDPGDGLRQGWTREILDLLRSRQVGTRQEVPNDPNSMRASWSRDWVTESLFSSENHSGIRRRGDGSQGVCGDQQWSRGA